MPIRFASLFLLAGLAVGCHKATYTTGPAPSSTATAKTKAFYLWGLVRKHEIDVTQVCGNEAAWFQNRQTFLNGFLSAITLGIYTPRKFEIRCAATSTAAAPAQAPTSVQTSTPIALPATLEPIAMSEVTP